MPVNAPTAAKWNAATISWNMIFRQVLEATQNYWGLIASELTSDTREQDYPWLDRLPAMRKWQGERVINNAAIRLQTITNDLFELTVGVKRTDVDDDKLGVLSTLVQEVARQAKVWPDRIIANAVQAGEAAVVFDNQYYFDTDHPINPDDPSQQIGGGNTDTTQANLFTSTASGNYPGALPLSSPSLEAVTSYMMSLVGADGQPLEIMPDAVMVPPQLKWTAARLLQAEVIGADIALAASANNPQLHGAAGQSNVMRGSMDLIVNPYLRGDATSYYVMCTKRAVKPFVWQIRDPPEFAVLTSPTDEHVFKHDELLWGVRARGAAGYSMWPLIAKCKAT
jgi:phage major head subunit gpT-like protein